ncbi:hypothetical protein EXIGLDRAFT_805734, partial [Exidia glandulosa HHB12029]
PRLNCKKSRALSGRRRPWPLYLFSVLLLYFICRVSFCALLLFVLFLVLLFSFFFVTFRSPFLVVGVGYIGFFIWFRVDRLVHFGDRWISFYLAVYEDQFGVFSESDRRNGGLILDLDCADRNSRHLDFRAARFFVDRRRL